jgi:TonB family protein
MRPTFIAFTLIVSVIPFNGALDMSLEAQAPEEQIDVDLQVQRAKIIKQTTPEYPPLARQSRVEGTVRLEAIIDKNGKVQELKVLSGHPLLIQSSLNAVRTWQYAPTLLNGKRVKVLTEIDVVYSLNPDSQPTKSILPSDGSFSEGRYSNRFFGFTYSIPPGWTYYSPEAMAEMSNSTAEKLSGSNAAEREKFAASASRTYKLFMLSRHPLGTRGKDTGVIMLETVNLSDSPQVVSGKEYLLSLQRVAEHFKGPLQFSGEPVEIRVAGRQFYRLDGQGSSPDGPLYHATLATVLQGYVLSFSFTCSNQSDLESLCKTLESLRFDRPGS